MKKTNDPVQEGQILEPAACADESAEGNIPQPDPEIDPELPVKYRVDSSIGLNVRSGPGLGYPILRQLAHGDEVEVSEPMQDTGAGLWAPVDGGWVAAEFLVLAGAEA